MPKKKDPDILTRTLSERSSFDYHQTQILNFMSHESKNIYNFSIFHTLLYLQHSNSIFKELYQMVKLKKITNITQFDTTFFDIYDSIYQNYLLVKPFKKHNNDVIYSFIKKYLNEIHLVNYNYYLVEKFIITALFKSSSLKFPDNCSQSIKNELFYAIVSKILQSIYHKNFISTKQSILSKRRCHISDDKFIQQVKNNKHLFSENLSQTKNYKALLKNHKLFNYQKCQS